MKIATIPLVSFALYLYPGIVLSPKIIKFKAKEGSYQSKILKYAIYLSLIIGLSLITNTLVTLWALFLFGWLPKNILFLTILFFPLFLRKIITKPLSIIIPEIKTKEVALEFSILFLFITTNLFIFRPLIRPLRVEGYNFYSLPQIGDLYKHLYVPTAIKESGIPPSHPYFPSKNLSYYYGYYLPIAVSSYLSGLSTNASFFIQHFFFLLFYAGICLLLINLTLKSGLSKIVTLLFLTLSFGLDILGNFLTYKTYLHYPAIHTHIEAWSWELGSKLQVTKPYTASMWVPQHLTAAVLTLISLLLVGKGIRTTIPLSLLIANVFLDSTFVFLSLLLGAGIYLLFSLLFGKQKRESLIFLSRVFALSFILTLPLTYQLFLNRGRTNLLHFSPIRLTKINQDKPLQFLLYFLFNIPIEWGVILPLAALGAWKLRSKRTLFPYLLWGWASFILTQIIVSPNVNDFGMRFIIPTQLGAILLSGKTLDTIRKFTNSEKRRIFPYFLWVLVGVNIVLGIVGSFWEFKERWQKREVLTWEDSQIVEYTRNKIPLRERLVVYSFPETSKWAEIIPVLGERLVYSPNLFSAGVYFVPKKPKTQLEKNFFSLPNEIFQYQEGNLGKNNPQEIITALATWLDIAEKYGAKKLLLRDKIWVQDDQEPVSFILRKIIPSAPKVANHHIFKIGKLKEEINKYLLVQSGPIKKIEIKNEKEETFLERGIYQIEFCLESNEPTKLHFDLNAERHYHFFGSAPPQSVKPNQLYCLTRLFVMPKGQKIILKTKQNPQQNSKIELSRVRIRKLELAQK